MRCFLAIEITEETKRELLRVEDAIKPFIQGNFVEPKNMHLTLKFFGEIPNEKVEEIRNSLRKIKFPKFRATIGKMGFFSPAFIRVAWVSLEPSDKIKALYEEIEKVLGNKVAGFESHVAIVRVKKLKSKERLLRKVSELDIGAADFPVEAFVLKKSTLTPKGPIYEDVEKFKLI